MNFKMKHIVTILMILSFYYALSQDVKFIASVQKNPVTEGERFQITFTLHNAQGERFTPPRFDNFNTLMGPSRQQSTTIINGNVSTQTSFTYVLEAIKKGSFTIGPATITVNGNRIQSNTITIDVVEPSQAEKQRREQAQKQEQSLTEQAQNIIKKNIFVTLSVNKTNVYLGEPISATYKIYVHPDLNLTNLSPKKEPTFNGFWTQNINIDNIQWQNEQVNGVWFRSATIKKVILIPQQTGKLIIEPYKFDCVARLRVQNQRQRRSIWDEFFDDPFFNRGNYRDFSYVASSQTIYVNVQDYPKPQPDDFINLTGNYTLQVWVDKPKTKAGEPISLKVKISGNGNLKLLEPLNIKFPPDFEVYDPKTIENLTVSSSGITGNKIFEYLIIPKHEGEYKIEPIKFSYFDLTKKNYVQLISDEFTITVTEGKESSTNIISGIQKEDIKFLGKDIRYIKLNTQLKENNKKFFTSTLFYSLTFLPLALFVALILYKKRRDELVSNKALWRNRQATKVAKKRLTNAKKLLELNDNQKFYEEISHALWGYISDKLNIPIADLSRESTSQALSQLNIDPQIINSYLEIIDKSEFARFTPESNSISKNDIYNNAVKVISQLEGVIK